jgi:hypothetical protein
VGDVGRGGRVLAYENDGKICIVEINILGAGVV